MTTLMTAENPESWKRRCDASCHGATGWRCECICGGVNHGIGRGGPRAVLDTATEKVRSILNALNVPGVDERRTE